MMIDVADMTEELVGYFDGLELLTCGMDCTFTSRFDQRWPDLMSIQYLTKGVMLFGRDGTGEIELTAPAVYWIDPWHNYQLAGIDGADVRHYVIFRGRRGRRLIEQGLDPLGSGGHMAVRAPDRVQTIFRELANLGDSVMGLEQARVAILFDELLLALLEGDRHVNSGAAQCPAIGRAVRIMREAPHERVDMRQLARDAGLSYSHFRALFRRYVGRPPQDFLLQCRMSRASQQLRDRGRRIKDIAIEAGYDDPGQFSRAFKKQMGLSPRAFREGVWL